MALYITCLLQVCSQIEEKKARVNQVNERFTAVIIDLNVEHE